MTAPADPFAPRLYDGRVMHMRLRPVRHRFSYRVRTAWLDVDRLGETAAGLRLLAVDRPGLFSVRRADHGPRDGSDLRPWVEARLAEAGLAKPARIMLLAMPRLLGHAFNPLSVYFCYDRAGALEGVVYQVKNTFGDQHAYALPARADADGAIRHRQPKEFFVSPFIPMEQVYAFTLRPPGARLSLRIRQADAEGPYLIATQSGAARPLTDTALAGLALRAPWAMVKVLLAIHWQALRLWLKGVKFLGHPGEGRVVRRAGGAIDAGGVR